MVQVQFYTYINVDAKLRFFIKTLISIYQKRANFQWQSSQDCTLCSVIFIDWGLQSTDPVQKYNIQDNQFMIVLNENDSIVHPRVFYINPKKQGLEILEIMQRCENALIEESQATAAQNYYLKLNKWLPLAVIREEPNFAILATIVMNKKLDLAGLAKESGFSLIYCNLFMQKGKTLGFLDLFNDAGVPLQASPDTLNEKQGILSRIRTRLGLMKRK